MSFTVAHLSPSAPRFLLPALKPPPPLTALLLFNQPSRTCNFPLGSNNVANPCSNGIGDRIIVPRNCSRPMGSEYVYGGDEGLDEDEDDDDDDEDEDEDEEDRSLDLLVKFVQNVFRKVSKRARKAARSVLPSSISTSLVGFAVNGVLILAFLWVLKAFLEVICTLGSVVFVSILLIRVVWSAVSYLQESQYLKMNGYDDDHRAWTNAQPVS